jgi:hypothetical protein
MNDLTSKLTYPEARAALQILTESFAVKAGKKMDELPDELADLSKAQGVALPNLAIAADADLDQVGPLYIGILDALLDSGDEYLVAKTQAAILTVEGAGTVQSVTLIVAIGAVVLAIGLLSKIEMKDGKLVIHKGFPDLEKVPGVVKSLFSAGTAN